MNAITREKVEELFQIEMESVESVHGYRFKNEQEALGCMHMEMAEVLNELEKLGKNYEELIKELTAHEKVKGSASLIIEDTSRCIQELVQVGSAAYKILRGFQQ